MNHQFPLSPLACFWLRVYFIALTRCASSCQLLYTYHITGSPTSITRSYTHPVSPSLRHHQYQIPPFHLLSVLHLQVSHLLSLLYSFYLGLFPPHGIVRHYLLCASVGYISRVTRFTTQFQATGRGATRVAKKV